jgi:hypothetical protein
MDINHVLQCGVGCGVGFWGWGWGAAGVWRFAGGSPLQRCFEAPPPPPCLPARLADATASSPLSCPAGVGKSPSEVLYDLTGLDVPLLLDEANATVSHLQKVGGHPSFLISVPRQLAAAGSACATPSPCKRSYMLGVARWGGPTAVPRLPSTRLAIGRAWLWPSLAWRQPMQSCFCQPAEPRCLLCANQ